MITTVTMNTSIDKAYFMDHEVQNGTVMRVSRCRNSAGGKGLNVARAVKLCGEKVQATGLAGGFNGKYLESLLEKDEVQYQFLHIAGETRCCINILDECYGSTEYLEPGCEVAAEEEDRFLQRFPEIIQKSKIITISGSVPRGISKNIYAKMISKAKEMGKKVILDTSGELLKEGIKAKPTVVKPNQDEIELLYEVKIHTIEDVIKYARKIYEQGIPYVVISLGGEGALMVCEEGVFQGKPPKLEVVNTVGCGDSMIAGFALGLSEGLSLEETLRRASAISAAAAMREETGFFVMEDMEKLLPQIKIEKL